MRDIDIIKRVKSGEIESFSILIDRYHNHLLNFIFRIVRDESIVEDIGQEVFLSVYRSLKDFDESRGTPFSAWLFITARNRCVSELRKNGNRIFVLHDETDKLAINGKTGEDIYINKEKRQALYESLTQLPEPFRKTILMSLRGDSLNEIAECEGISVGTVKSRLSRAKEKIKVVIWNILGGKEYEGV